MALLEFPISAVRHGDVIDREGVSSTLLLQRILHPAWPRPDPTPLTHLLDDFADAISPRPKIIDLRSLSGHHHVFPKPRKVNSKVIYVGGSWDCFGSAHVEFLERAKALYLTDQIVLVVGIVSDEVSSSVQGTHL